MLYLRTATAGRWTITIAMVVSLICIATAPAVAGGASALSLALEQPTLDASSERSALSGTEATALSGTEATAAVDLGQSCAPLLIKRLETTQCVVTATNNSFADVVVDLNSATSRNLLIKGSAGATLIDARHTQLHVSLLGGQPGVPSVGPGDLFGYIPLDAFGVAPVSIGDEDILNFNVPDFVYAGSLWNRIGVDSNGYVVVGGGTPEDNNCCDLPGGEDPERPNNILAPFWTDLDGTGTPGIYAATLTDGVDTWVVVEFRVNVFGTTSGRVFQIWIGVDGVEDITFAYDPANLPADPGFAFLIGAENAAGQGDLTADLPTQDLRVVSTDSVPGEAVTYVLTVRGQQEGTGTVTTEIQGLSDVVVLETQIQVNPKKP